MAKKHDSFEGLNCPTCDYDLRGLAEQRCPECGTVFEPEAMRLDRDRKQREESRRIFGVAGAGVAAIFSILVVCGSLMSLLRFAGTTWFLSRGTQEMMIRTMMPTVLSGAVIGAVIAWWAGFGFRLARVSVLIALITWILCRVWMEYL